jgi:hypothetical protein
MRLEDRARRTRPAPAAPVQRMPSRRGAAREAPAVVHDVLRTPGQPLEPGARAMMESRLGHDFSRVRVHTDAHAAESARSVDALAYTVGRDVVFGARQYSPGTPAGQRLLAHELVHVTQQEQTTSTSGTLAVGATDSPAERNAAAAAGGASGSRGSMSPRLGNSSGLSGRTLQRQPAPESATPGAAAPDAAPVPSIVASPSGVTVLENFDVAKGPGRRPWNLDRLARKIAAAFAAAPGSELEIIGYWDPNDAVAAKIPIETEIRSARNRAGLVRDALLQWVNLPPGRVRVSTFDRTVLSPGAATSQISVVHRTVPRDEPQAAEPATPQHGPPSGRVGLPPRDSDLTAAVGNALAGVASEKSIVERKHGKVAVSVGGSTVELKKGRFTASGTLTWGGGIGVAAKFGDLHFEGQVSAEKWELKLTYPTDTLVPNMADVTKIFREGHSALGNIADSASGFKHVRDIPGIQERVKEHLPAVKEAIDAIKGVADAKRKFMIGGSVSGPGTGKPGTPGMPQGTTVGVTLTVRFW